MSTLSRVSKGLNSVAAPQLIGADYSTSSNEFWMLNQTGGIDYKFSYSGHQSSLKAYRKCAPLTAIINKKAQAFSNGKTWILNKKGKAKEKEATSEIARKVRTLMANPNPFQSQKDFEAQQYIYCQLFGYCLMLPIRPVGFPNSDATTLWNIPPVMVDIEETKKSWLLAKGKKDLLKKIIINFQNERVELSADDVYIIKDFTPSFDSPIIPESRVCALEMQVNNIMGAYESRNVLINYRGALGIISPDSKDSSGPVKLMDEDKLQLQNDFLRYGLKNSQWKFIMSSASIKWSQMGVPTRELMLFEEIEDDIMRICDGYNFPYPLLSSNRTNSLGGNNIGESKQLLYQDAIIPESESICEQWSSFFDLNKYDLLIIKDFSHVAALQGDEQKKAQARKTRNEAMQIEFLHNICTLNQWRIANGDDPVEDELGGKLYYELVQIGWKFGSTGATLSINQQQEPSTQTTEPA